jgi:hypothetical protein
MATGAPSGVAAAARPRFDLYGKVPSAPLAVPPVHRCDGRGRQRLPRARRSTAWALLAGAPINCAQDRPRTD